MSAPGATNSALAGEERILDWEGALNARDTGGLPTADGRQIKRGALVRSDVLTRLTPSGRRALIDHGVRTIVDVRSSEELGRDVDYPFQASASGEGDPTYLHVSFLTEMTDEQEAQVRDLRASARQLGELNRLDIEIHRAGVGAVIGAVANAEPGGVLIHCYAGKDRTGLSVGLLLAVAGVSDNDIADDYALTMLNLEPLLMDWLDTVEDDAERERLRELASPRREAMLETLAHIRERYGDVEGYLRGAGVSDEQLARIRARLVDDAPGEAVNG